jgi:hypothetical protein
VLTFKKSRFQPIKFIIEKKDEINEYKKKKCKKKRKRQKEERTSVPRPLSWNIYAKKQCHPANCLSVYDIVFPMFWTFLW